LTLTPKVTPLSPDLLPSQRLLRKDQFFFLRRFDGDESSPDSWQDSGEGTSVSLIKIQERVGEVLDQVVGVDVRHNEKRIKSSDGRARESID